MFEKILERVLLSHFGKYLTGFDRNNLKLGVWSGNVVIENVKVKPEILESLELPVELIHSSIGRLVMKVPWNKLSSAPVEVLIEDILIVIAPKDPKDWDFSDGRLVQKKLNVMMNYALTQIEKCLTKKKKKNEPEDQQGYFDKLTLKVIDNLQLSVKNIHIRWECKSGSESYAWGMKLNSLDAFTTNIEWKRQYIDRTDVKNRSTPMNKLVLLDKLIVYWNSKETVFFDDAPPSAINSLAIEEVINISAEFKWSQSVKSLFEQPLFDVSFDLNWIDITLKHSQLQQLIMMLESISLYTKLLWMERKGITHTKYDQDEFKSTFCSLFTRMQRSEQKSFEVLEEQEITQMNDIIRQVEYATLFIWTQSVMKILILESKVLELQKQRSKRGWFGGRANTVDSVVQEQEIKELESYIETSLEEETDEFESDAVVRPPQSIKYKGSVLLKGGSIQIIKEYTKGQMELEGIKLNCKEVKFDLVSKQNKDFDSFFSVDTFGMYIQSKIFNQAPILTALCVQQQSSDHLFKFSLFKTQADNNTNMPDLTVNCNLEPLTWVYNPGIISFIREIKDVKQGSLEESLKSATWNRLEKIQDNTQSRLQFLLANSMQLAVNFNMVQLKVIIPIPNSQTEAWSLNIAQVIIKSHQKSVEDVYEYFDVAIKQSSFLYETDCCELIGEAPKLQQSNLYVFKNYTVELQLAKMKESVMDLVQEESLMKLSGRLNPLELTLNEKSYRDLIYIPEAILPPQTQNQRLESLQSEKQQVVNQQTQSGWIKSRGEHIRVWHKYFMILSGGYLYLYENETSLMPIKFVYIKNGQIKRMGTSEEDQEEFAFTLDNRYDSCILACDDDSNLVSWMEVLNVKIKEYATEEEYIKLKEEELDSALVDKHRNKNQLDISLAIGVTEITLFKGASMQDALLYLRAEGVKYNYQQSPMSIKTQASMMNLVLRDWTHQFKHAPYQDLISMSSQQRDHQCLDINIVQLNHQHERYDKVDLFIKCAVEDICVNWKPDTFLKLHGLMMIVSERESRKWYYSSVKDYEVDAIKKGAQAEDLKVRKLTEAMNDSLLKCKLYNQTKVTVKDHFDYFMDYDNFALNYDWIYNHLVAPFYKQQSYQKPSSIIIQLDCQIRSADFNFFQFQSHALLFKAQARLADFTFRKLQFNNFLTCNIHDVSMFEMTNYPFSVDSNVDFNKIVPFKLIGRRPGYEGELVRFRFGGYEELIYPNADRCNVFLLIEINPVFAIYQHQPIMRVIDYIVVQIVLLLRQPEYLTMNAAVLAQKRMSTMKTSNPLQAKRVWGDLDEIFKKFICPTFVDCRVVLQNPNLQIKGWQHFEQYFQVDAKEIRIFNSQEIDNSRLLVKGGIPLVQVQEGMPDGRIREAWCENYMVEARELVIQYVDGGAVKGMSLQMNFNLCFQRILNSNEVQVVFPEVQYDRSLKIRSAMTPIVLKAYRNEYLQVCRMIFHNFQYDDQMDRIFIHDFEVVRSFDPSPISFFLDFTEVSIFAMSVLQVHPLAQINMNRMRLKWIRDGEMNIELDIFGQVCTMFHYTKLDDASYEERGFVGNLQQYIVHTLMGNHNGLDVDTTFYKGHAYDLKEEFKMYEFKDYDESNVQFTLLFKIIRPLGDKNIYIYLKDVKMIVQLSVFANVGLWSLLDQTCWPPQNDFGEMPGIQLFTEIRNVSLCLPVTSGDQVMATKGEISYIFNRARMPNHQWMILQQRAGKLDARLVHQIGDAFEHKITLQSMELFKCHIDDFVNLPVQEVPKRNIIMPFFFFLGIKNELQMSSQGEPQIYYLNKYEANIDKTIVKFSYQDLIVLIDIIDFNKNQAKMIQREPDQQVNQVVSVPTTPLNNVYDAIIHGLQVVIINDAGEAYVPVFDLTVSESQMLFHQTRSKSILSTVVSLSSTFFNPLIAVWEPIIERCTFALDMSLNQVSNPKKYVILEMNSPQEILNINLSTQMLGVFHRTYLSWAKEMTMSKKQSLQTMELQPRQNQSVLFQTHNRTKIRGDLDELRYYPEERKDKDNESRMFKSFQSQSLPRNGTSKLQWGVVKNDLIETIDHVSPYTIRNETGFLIEVVDDSNQGEQMYVIPTGGSANYQIDADIEQVFVKDTSTIRRQQLIKFRVIHNDYDFSPVCGVDMDSLRSRRVTLQCGLRSFCLFIEVVPKDTRKLLLITSETMIYNKTDKIVELGLFDGLNAENRIQLSVDPQRAISIPFDRTRAFMNFRFKLDHEQDTDSFSSFIDLEKIIELKEKIFEFKHSTNQYTVIRCNKRGASQTILYLEAPHIIKNCLPIEIEYELYSDDDVGDKNKRKFKAVLRGEQGKQQEIQVHNVSLKKRLGIKIRTPFYQWSDIGLLFNPFQQKAPRQQQDELQVDNIMMCDYRGRVGQIQVLAVDHECGSKLFYLHVPSFVVNDTQVQLYYFTNHQRNTKTLTFSAGQALKVDQQESSKVVLLGDTLYIQLGLSDEMQALSKELYMNLTGNDSIQMGGYELGVNVSLVCVDQQQQLFSKVMTVSPRFVLVNYTNHHLNIIQDECDHEPTRIQSQQRVPFNWARWDGPKLFRVQMVDNRDDIWGYSQPLDPNKAGFTCFTIRSTQNRSFIKYINCELRLIDQIVYLIFQECRIPQRSLKVDDQSDVNQSLCEIPYIIVNNLKDVRLVCYQSCFLAQTIIHDQDYQYQEYKITVPQQSQMPFAWEYPEAKNDIVIEFRFEGELSECYTHEPLVVSMESMDVERKYSVLDEFTGQEFKFYIMTQWEGKSKKLKLYQEEEIMERMRQEDIIELQLAVSIITIGVSLLDYDGPKRVELLYLTLKNVEFMLLETTVLRTSQLKIKYINIDSNSSNRTMFPVIMTPTKYRETFEFDRPQLSLVLAQSTQAKAVTLIKSIRASLQPTTIRLTSEVLENIYAIFKNVQLQLKTNMNYETLSSQHDFEYALEFQSKKPSQLKDNKPLYLMNQVQQKYGHRQQFNIMVDEANDQHDWLISELPLEAKITYIDRIEIYPLYFNITFYNSVQSIVKYKALIRILKTIGIVLGNIDEAPIKLDGIYLENCFDTSAGITQKLATHYKDNLIQQLLKILGSIEIIGNPVGLFKHIATGVYDLLDKPIEGFIKGPIEGGIGIGKGVTSLVKNTVSGTFNSAGLITGAVAGGFSTISMDPQFQKGREQMKMAKPRQIFDGVAQGMLLLLQSVSRGVSGLILSPINGARQRGLPGALLGTFKGATGLIVKPLSGLFDLASKTAEGVKATAVYWDDKANEQRERDIRVMYAQEQFYKGYNIKDSQIMAYLQNHWEGQYADVSLYDAFLIATPHSYMVLVLSFQYILYVDYNKQKLVWVLDAKTLNTVDLMESGIIYTLKVTDKILNSKNALVPCKEAQLRQEMFQKSKWLLQSVSTT